MVRFIALVVIVLASAGGASAGAPPRGPAELAAGEAVFESRLRALAESVARGERLYARWCRSCHDAGAVTPAALLFPAAGNGQVESLERFLGRHRPELPRLGSDGQPSADVIAFLMSRLAGRPVSVAPFSVAP